MKIRQGFVSNSSSSSFVALCKPITLDEITTDMLDGSIFTFGSYLYDGRDRIYLTSEIMLKYFKLFPSYIDEGYENNFGFYKIVAGESFTKKDLIGGDEDIYEIISEEVDYHCTSDIDDLFSKYSNVEIDKENYEEYISQKFREKKLERINKNIENEN